MLAPIEAWIDKELAANGTSDTSLFLNIFTTSPHYPYLKEPPANGAEEEEAGHGNKAGKDTDGGSGGATTHQRYEHSLDVMDAFLRDLHAAFESRGLLPHTLFVFVGDHGESLGERGDHQHGTTVWQEAIQVPLLLSGPGIWADGTGMTKEDAQRSSIGGLRSIMDIRPTVMGWLGMPNVVCEGATGTKTAKSQNQLQGQHLAQILSGIDLLHSDARVGGHASLVVFSLLGGAKLALLIDPLALANENLDTTHLLLHISAHKSQLVCLKAVYACGNVGWMERHYAPVGVRTDRYLNVFAVLAAGDSSGGAGIDVNIPPHLLPQKLKEKWTLYLEQWKRDSIY